MNIECQDNEDNHHVLYNRKQWESSIVGYELRNNKAFIVPMDRQLHEQLHKSIGIVPVLGEKALHKVYSNLLDRGPINPDIHPKIAIDSLILAIDKVSNCHLTEHDRALGEIAVYILEEQVPLISESIDNREQLLLEHKRKGRRSLQKSGRHKLRYVNNSR